MPDDRGGTYTLYPVSLVNDAGLHGSPRIRRNGLDNPLRDCFDSCFSFTAYGRSLTSRNLTNFECRR